MGKRFQQLGNSMINGNGKLEGENWKICEHIKEHHHRLYGNDCKFNGKLGKMNQCKSSKYLGPGYGTGVDDMSNQISQNHRIIARDR